MSSLVSVPPSPFRNADGTLTAAGIRGREVFRREDVGCAKCHAGSAFTDSRLPLPGESLPPGPLTVFPGAASFRTSQGFLLHDVGTKGPFSGFRMSDTLPGLDTPTLKGLWMGGPYLHDGSAANLQQVLAVANARDKHGKTSQLTPGEMEDLLAYLNQIDELDDQGNTGIGVRGKPGRAAGPSLSAERMGRHVRIRFRLEASHEAVVGRLFNLQGAVLAEFRAPAGTREGHWTWDGRDGQGRPAGTGLYLLRAGSRGGSQSTVSFILR